MAISFRLDFMFLIWVLYVSLLQSCCGVRYGEAASATITDPQEVLALKAIKDKMRYRKWDFSEDPCSGKGSWNVNQTYEVQNRVVCEMYRTRGRIFFHVTRIYLKNQNLTGVLPAELANLTYLEEIDFSCNHLNGQIPSELGSLTHLKNLSLGMNHLSGYIPKEVGNLIYLQKLDLFSNELHGQLPESLVNLTRLKMLMIQSNQLHGRLPQIYEHFHGLEHFVASSNNFSGKIPDFIGNWRNLMVLELEATSLEGPIPPTFSSLIQLEDLDLRFNNLTGSIPKTLENTPDKHPKIEYLYLGNNSLRGELQQWLSTINNVDLSDNYFSGELNASWIIPQMNLIQNSFNNDNSNGRYQAYLQRGFTCKAPQYTSLAINCGGNPWGTYEGDTSPLGPSSYFSSSNGKWAVSNTGHFMGAEKHQWIVTGDNSQFAKGTDTELYGTARCSSSSLRYYALCLQNGQYNVQLHFAEIAISSETAFASLGRRIFDVYIQGTRILKDFNIKDAAGGSSYKVVIRNFNINVTENYLEVHFFWAGKGTFDIPVKGTYGPLVSAIKISPNFKVNDTSKGRNKSNNIMIIGIVSGAAISLGFAVCLTFIFIRKINSMENTSFAANDDTELTDMGTISNKFSLDVIKIATNNFDPENKLGEGGFGAVFKGVLPNGKIIAVKQMFPKTRRGIREFLNEVGTISAMHHLNLVELYGFCVEGNQLLLVYEYMENNSLAHCLFGPQECRFNLDWPQRYKICLGVAHGLAYLHEGSRLRIIHRDIKAMNILLDQDLNPKISDFGLAKLFDEDKTHVTTRLAGTIGYMAPEYVLKGHLTEKADVYSFGVVVLEVVSGRSRMDKNLQDEMIYLLEWTWQLYEKEKLLDLLDANLKNSVYSNEEVLRMINVGLLCTRESPLQRPSMSTVVGMLEGKIEVNVSHSRPSYILD